MLKYIKKRYTVQATCIRGLAHGMCTGLAVAWLVTHVGVLGFYGLFLGLAIEISQAAKDIPKGKFNLKDSMCDLLEHTVGGLILGTFFYLTRGF